MAPTMPVSGPSAGGLKNAIARCVATRCPSMRCVSVASWPGVATSSIRRMGLSWQGSCSKQKLPGILTACSFLTTAYQLSNDHGESLTVATSLHLIEGGVVASPGHEFGVTACLDDAAAIQHHDLIGHPHRREAMADQQPCFPGDECAEVLEELVFSLGVQG